MIIHQAIFGYSNGHHLLSSSRQLSNQSIKILEPLSDMSGTEIQNGFSEYITGYPLVEDNYYALCKTWYATEMKRPGCVWTHVLLINSGDLKLLSNIDTLVDLFKRPILDDNFESYKSIIDFHCYNNINPNHIIDEHHKKSIYNILYNFFDNNNPIFIATEDAKKYNEIIELIWRRMAYLLFKSFSFCTGSLSSRTIDKKIIDLQVVPLVQVKNISRQIKNPRIISEDYNNFNSEWLDLIFNEYIELQGDELHNFIYSFNEVSFERPYIKYFAQLLLLLKKENFDISKYFEIILNNFYEKDQFILIDKSLRFMLIQTYKPWISMMNDSSYYLKQLSRINIDISKYLDDNSINEILKNIWNISPDRTNDIFDYLITNEINIFGEKLLISLALMAEPNQLIKITGNNLIGCNVLISINYRLSLCKDIWLQNKALQIETLNSLIKSSNKFTYDFIRDLSTIIFYNSKEDLCRELYNVFGSIIVEMFLLWANQTNLDEINKWAKLCKYDSLVCLKNLSEINNISLINNIINILDPLCDEVRNVDKNLWINLYRKHYKKCNIKLYNDNYAQLLIFIVLSDNERYPDDVLHFSFDTVHRILAREQMAYDRWEKLSKLIPEVSWYNSWDKCKRLRKAATLKGYYIDPHII